ncbi:PREDICTED: anoctamin-10-like [Priapulus caudatus]|uniref:Anoctamin n=1 Tax=Priapulus caudatus TaxID=37621 RepID=A0ABM1E226_PRICU|nr:PREDICTED: anoctamin-10-like [Priapulus caudatus]
MDTHLPASRDDSDLAKLYRFELISSTYLSQRSLSTEATPVAMERQTKSASPALDAGFPPLVVVEFCKDVQQELLDWMVTRLRAGKSVGGAELLVRVAADRMGRKRVLHVGATKERLLEAAELSGIRKPNQEGFLSYFTCKNMQDFTGKDNDMDSLLSTAEKQRLVEHELINMRAIEFDKHLPGYDKLTLYVGKSLIQKCMNKGVIVQMYPLHERDTLKRLGHDWYQNLVAIQPLDDIRSYFGEKLGVYFAFLGFYTQALVPPALIGIVYFLLSWDNVNKHTFFAGFNLIWVTVFLEAWKRRCNELAYGWGTIGMQTVEEPRAAFKGTMGVNPVTGRNEPTSPSWKRNVKLYGASLPIVMVCLIVAFYVMLIYFRLEFWAQGRYKLDPTLFNRLLLFVPTTLYALVVLSMNAAYRVLATKLTNWENHRLQSSYENQLIVKLVLFDFINCFMSLFYIAFVLQDLRLLRISLATLLITMQIVGQMQEVLVPYLLKKYKKWELQKQGKENGEEKFDDMEMQKRQAKYPGTFDDYLELFLQFGYVFLFSSAYPLAAFWALLNNVLEVRTDAFKLCRVFQRPFSHLAASVGAWQVAFEVMGVIAVITNCALIAISPQSKSFFPESSTTELLLIFVGIEHLILGAKLCIAYLVPDTPEWVETALAKIEHQSREALKHDRSQQTRRLFEKGSSLDIDFPERSGPVETEI